MTLADVEHATVRQGEKGGLKAFIVQETDEGTGGVVFARSAANARRIGAARYSFDEFDDLSVTRAKHLDGYVETGVPASVMIESGWYFECQGCGMRIDEYSLHDEGLSVSGVVGTEDGPVFCCDQCERRWRSTERRKQKVGAAFLAKMKDWVRRRFGDVEFEAGPFKEHVYVIENNRRLIVQQAILRFRFPGMKIGPAEVRYDATRKYGPQPFVVYCCAGDREAFEAFADSTTPPEGAQT